VTGPLLVDDALIDRYAAGECSPDEVERVSSWIGGDPSRRARVARAKEVWEAARAQSHRWDVDRAWERARAVIGAESVSDRTSGPAPVDSRLDAGTHQSAVGKATRTASRPRVGRAPVLAAAACVTLAIGLLAWWQTPRHVPMAAPESIATGPRQRVTVELRDGSRVVLAPESRLVEPAEFGVSSREVELEGAAYFDVVHDASRPFIVVTRDLRIRDLGTRFAVDAYSARPASPGARTAGTTTRVAVTAGSIEMETVSSSAKAPQGARPAGTYAAATIVRAGHLGRMDEHGRITVTQPTDIDQYVSWTTDYLAFDDVPLSEAVPRLERWYGVRIRLGDAALACRHITARFHDESLDQVLDELSLALHARRDRSAGGPVTLTSSEARPRGTGQTGQMPDTALECAQAVH
jgi:transmembrane sensor